MSRINKVNPGQYTIAGRLTLDDLGRELEKQVEARSVKKAPPAPAPKRRTQTPRAAPPARGRVRPRGQR